MRFPLFRRNHRPDRLRRAPLEPEGGLLADEVEAWINGELAALRSSRSPPTLAPWLVLNRLAHAEPATVRCIAQDEPASESPLRWQPTWAAAERAIARQLVDAAPTGDELVLRQRGVLVPLEITQAKLWPGRGRGDRPPAEGRVGQVVEHLLAGMGDRHQP